MYEPTWESVATHEVPAWYEDAKLGIFIHWGLYSVPGWAPHVPDIQTLIRERGPRYTLSHLPYAEWYLNSMQIMGSPTQLHHRETYGASFSYDDFVPMFDEGSRAADMDALADLCKMAGGRYVVLTTKHGDGFALWPTSVDHPTKGRYHAERDLVADLSTAVRVKGMRMGLYYSGGHDWAFNDKAMKNLADVLLSVPADPVYLKFATGQIVELIDRYRPAVLWNDIGWPVGGNLAEVFSHYYNTVDDGVVNDRWTESPVATNPLGRLIVRTIGGATEAVWRVIPERLKQLTMTSKRHCDFRTREYDQIDRISHKKWESCRGVGHSFGANRNEPPEDIISGAELIRSFVDIVSKNGNLLIGVGPDPNGVVPAEQAKPLRELGLWLSANGEAIYESRPWGAAEGQLTDGTPLRFTARDDVLYVIVMESPRSRHIEMRDIPAAAMRDARLLGVEGPVEWSANDDTFKLTLPDRLPTDPPIALALIGAGASSQG